MYFCLISLYLKINKHFTVLICFKKLTNKKHFWKMLINEYKCTVRQKGVQKMTWYLFNIIMQL